MKERSCKFQPDRHELCSEEKFPRRGPGGREAGELGAGAGSLAGDVEMDRESGNPAPAR